jgi:hypothetical protein
MIAYKLVIKGEEGDDPEALTRPKQFIMIAKTQIRLF